MAVETAVRPRSGVNVRANVSGIARVAAYGLLLATLAGYAWLAYLYQAAIPAWEAPDETGHFAYVRYLVEEHDFPRRTVGGNDQFHQPPLAYLAGALAVRDLDLSDFDRLKPNPAFIWTRRGDQPNAVLHTQDEGPPYRGLFEALHRLRLLAILAGAGTVLATFAVARTVFPARPLLAVAAAVFVGGLPQFVFATSVFNNDALATLLCSLAIWSLTRIVTGRDASAWEHARLGLWLGLATLTKVNAFAVVAVVALVLLWRFARACPPLRALPLPLGEGRGEGQLMRREQPSPQPSPRGRGRAVGAFRRGAVTAAVLAVVGAPWYVRNYVLYHGLLANQSYIDDQTLPQIAAFGLTPAAILRWFLTPLFESAFAQFGWMTIKADADWYRAFAVLLALAALGLVVWLLRGAGRPAERAAVAVGGLLVASLVGLILLRWVTTIGNHYPQGRYLFLILPAVALLVVVGLDTLLARRAPALIALGLGLGLFGATSSLAGAYSSPAYRPLDLWLEPPATIQHPVGYVLGAQLHLVGYDLDRAEAAPGDSVKVAIYWQALDRPPTDYHTFLHLALPTNEPVSQDDTVPGAPVYPPSRWVPGDVIRQAQALAIPADLAPGRYRLLVGAYRYPELTRLPATAPIDGGDFLEIGAVTVRPR